MADADLGALLEPHKTTLENIATSLAAGDSAKTAGSIAALVGALATGHPEIAILTPFAQSAVAKAFGNSADAMLRRELAAMVAEEEKQKLAAQIAEPIEALIGQALIQLVRVQHNVKDEVLAALGGVREDLAAFREQFARDLSAFDLRLDRVLVEEGAIGLCVGPEARKRVWIADMTVRGRGSIGIDLR